MYTGEIGQIFIDVLKGVSGVKPVQLTPGQVVNVQVKKVVGDTALLNYQGQEIGAKLETEIPTGQQLRCLVEGEKNGQVILKVLNSNQEFESSVLKSILNNLGLQDTDVNRAIIRQMVKMEMPLTLETVRQLSAFIQSQKVSAKDAWISVFMKNQGLPLNTEMFVTVKGLLTDLNFLHASLEKLLSATSNEVNSPQIKGELKQILSELSQTIRNMQLNGEDPPETVALKLTSLFKQFVSSSGTGTVGINQAGPVPAQANQAGPVPAQANQAGPVPGQANQTGPVPGQANQTGPVPGQANQAAPMPGQANQAGPVPGQANQAAPMPAQANQAGPVPAQANQAAPMPAQANQAGPVPAQANQAGPVPGQANQAAPMPGQANQAAPMPGQANQAAPMPAQADQAIPMPGQANQAGPVPAQADQAIPMPGQANQAAPMPAQANQAAPVPAQPAQAAPTPSLQGNLAENADAAAERVLSSDNREAINNIINRLGEAAQKDPGMDSARIQQFMARLNSLLDGAGVDTSPKPDLLPLLGKVIEGLSKTSDHESTELLKLAQNVMSKLEVLHGFNNKTEPGKENVLIMYSTVRFGDKEEPLSLFVNYRHDGKNKKRDFNSCRIEVKLQTPNLSLVRCEVQVNYKNLNLQFICDNDKTGQRVDSIKESLLEKLRQMNYQVTSLATKIETVEEVQGTWFHDKPDKPGIFKINLRV